MMTVKDVCEPKSNDSSSPTSTIVEEFDSLVGEIIKQKEEVKKISDPVARRRACFTSNLENFRIIHQGRVIHSPQIASVGAISHIFPNNNLEDSFKMGDEDLNFIPNKELDKEDLIPIPRESKIGKECDFPLCDDFQSFKTFSNPLFEKKDDFPSRNDESILKEEVHKETLKSYLNPLFEDDEEIISIEVSRQISPKVNSEPSIESLPKDDFDNDDDLFEMDSNNDEWKRILYGGDFERMNSDSDKTKDFDKSSSSVFKSLSDEFEPSGSSHVEGNDLICYDGISCFPDFGGFMVKNCGKRQCIAHNFTVDGFKSSLLKWGIPLNPVKSSTVIKKGIQAARDRQKSYADRRRKTLKFEVGDKVMLKVFPWKGVICFRKQGKLKPRHIGPFKILAKVGSLAYRLELPEQLS
ncbi:hypothetical protein Tco_0318760 [Tanacetum coccineum]